MELYEHIKEELESWGVDELVQIWNDYCNECNYMDDYVNYNDADELMCGETPSDIINGLGSHYSLNDRFAIYTIYGWESFDYETDEHCPIDIDTLANWIADDEDGHGYDALQDIVDEYLEEEEDEDEEEE